MKIKYLFFTLFSICALSASGYDFMVDGIAYNINDDGNSVTVTYEKTNSPRYSNLNGAIEIPSVVYYGKNYAVTSVGAGAFYYCDKITSVTISNSVTEIGNDAFFNCDGLKNVSFGNSIIKIGDAAFRRCSGLTNISIPNSVRTIGGDAFVSCHGLKNLTIGKSVSSMGMAFWGCLNLETIAIDKENTTYDSRDNCNAIIETATNTLITGCKNTFIPNSVTTIGELAFYECDGLKIIRIPSSVATIEKSAFIYCDSLTSITIPNSVTNIGMYAFHGCHSLREVYCGIKNLFDLSYGVFNGIDLSNCILYVPNGMQNEYNEHSIWGQFGQIIECNDQISSVVINKEALSIYVSGAEKLWATIYPSDVLISTLYWRSSNPIVAKVNQTGFVTSQSIGSATITATTTDGSNISASCEVVVKGIDYIELDKDELVIFKGDTETLVATYEPLDVIINTLTWRSSNSNIVTVDNNGNITAKAAGTATITVSTTDGSNLSASCEVTVLPLYGLQLDKSLSHTRGAQPEVVELSIDMSNKEDISGIQFDLYLPEGVTLAYLDGLPDVWLDDARRGRNHSVEVGQTAYGYRVLVSSPTNRVFSGHTGDVLHMNVIMSQYHPIGNYYIRLNNIVLAEPDETQHWPSNASTNVKLSYLVGDADADVSVDVADYTLTALHILARNPENFYIDAANVNNDNYINVADLVGITNIGLGIRPQELRQVKGHDAGHSTQQAGTAIHISGHQPACSQLAIALSSDRALAGFQCDLDLPTGVSIKKMEILGRAAKHQLSANTLQGGMMRILVSAFSDQDIELGDDDILLITLDGEADGVARLTNILGVERDMTTHKIDDATIDLNTTGVNLLNTLDHARIYVEDDRVVIESQHSGTAQLVRVNGITIPLQVHQGRNVYRLDAGFYMVHFEGQTAKILIQ